MKKYIGYLLIASSSLFFSNDSQDISSSKNIPAAQGSSIYKYANTLTTTGIIYVVSCSERKLLDGFVSCNNNNSIVNSIDAALTLTAGYLTTAVISDTITYIVNNANSTDDPIYQNYNKNIKALGLSLGAHALFRYMTQESP